MQQEPLLLHISSPNIDLWRIHLVIDGVECIKTQAAAFLRRAAIDGEAYVRTRC